MDPVGKLTINISVSHADLDAMEWLFPKTTPMQKIKDLLTAEAERVLTNARRLYDMRAITTSNMGEANGPEAREEVQ